MSNYSAKPRVGWVHPREATGPNAKEAALQAGAGNIEFCPPALVEDVNPAPSISEAAYPPPREGGLMADGVTGGNFMGAAPPVAPGAIPVQQKGGEEIGEE